MYVPILDILEWDGDYNLKIENISAFFELRLTRQKYKTIRLMKMAIYVTRHCSFCNKMKLPMIFKMSALYFDLSPNFAKNITCNKMART